jgi:hypothetical protein
MLQSQEILATPYDAAPGNYFGSSTGGITLKAAPEATASSGASPVGELSSMLAHVGPIGNVVSSNVNEDAIAASLHLSIPPTDVLLAGSRVLQTPDGPAVLFSSLQQAVVHPVAKWLTAVPRVSSSTGLMKKTLFSRLRWRSKVDRGTTGRRFLASTFWAVALTLSARGAGKRYVQ